MSITREATWVPQPATQRSKRTPLAYDAKHDLLAYASGRVVSVRSVASPDKGWLFTQHNYPVTSVAFAPSGFWAASGDAGGQVRIWDTELKENDEEISTKGPFSATSGRIESLAWDFESKRIFAVGDGKERFGHVFMFDSGNSVGEISGHGAAINAAAVKPNRPMRAVTVGEDNQVIFYEGPPFKFAKSASKHTNAVSDVAYSPDGAHFATAGFDRKIGLFDGKTGDFVRYLESGHTGSILAVSWKSDTEIVTASADASVRVVPVEGEPQVWQLPAKLENQQTGVVNTPDYTISVGLDGTLYYWTVGKEEPVKVVRGHQKTITALDATTNLFSGSIDGRVLEWKDGSASVVSTHDGPIVELTHAEEVLSAGWDKKITSVQPGTSLAVDEQPVAFAAAGDFVVSISENKLEVVGGPTVELKGRGSAVDANSEFVVAGYGNEAVVYDHSLKQVHSFGPQRADIASVRLSPDGKHLAVGDASGKIILYQTSDWSVVTSRWSFHTSRVTSIAWHTDSSRVVTGSTDSNIYVYSIERPGRNTKVLNAHKDGVTRVCWVSDDKIASGGNDGSIKLWKYEAPK